MHGNNVNVYLTPKSNMSYGHGIICTRNVNLYSYFTLMLQLKDTPRGMNFEISLNLSQFPEIGKSHNVPVIVLLVKKKKISPILCITINRVYGCYCDSFFQNMIYKHFHLA